MSQEGGGAAKPVGQCFQTMEQLKELGHLLLVLYDRFFLSICLPLSSVTLFDLHRKLLGKMSSKWGIKFI